MMAASLIKSLRLELFDGIRRNNLDAFDIHPLDRPIGFFGRGGGNFFQHAITFDELAELEYGACDRCVEVYKLRADGVM